MRTLRPNKRALIGSNVDKVDINTFNIIITSGAYTHGDPLPVYALDVCAHRPCSAAGGKCEWARALNYYILLLYCFYILLRLVAVMYESTNHGLSIIILTLYITVMINTLSDPSNDTSISKGPVVITRPRGCELSGQNTLSSVYHIVL